MEMSQWPQDPWPRKTWQDGPRKKEAVAKEYGARPRV